MNVLVTGGNGFLGSNVVKALLQKNYRILVFSRNCNSLQGVFDKITFIEQTSGYKEHTETIAAFQPDYVIHFAWDGGNKYAEVNSLKQFSVNIPYGIELLEILANIPKKPTFIGVGSFSEYGILTQKAKETQPENPVTFYGMAKSMFKTISNKFCIDNNIRWIWVRPCYIYGENDVPTRLIPSVIQKLKQNKDVYLDSCNVTIDYLHVDDFSNGIVHILKSESDGVFNICSGNEYYLKQILEYINSHTTSSGTIVFDKTIDRGATSSYICGDNTRLIELGWRPKVTIESGLLSTIRVQPS